LSDVGKDFWYECGKSRACVGGAGTRLGPKPVPIEDPIYEIQSLLRDRRAGRFDRIQAVSFANVGPGDSAP
jgi:hypothetical protein